MKHVLIQTPMQQSVCKLIRPILFVFIKFNFLVALLVFYVSTTCGLISFLILAKQWPALMDDWRAAEEHLPTFKNQKQRTNFIFKTQSITLLILFQATCINSNNNKIKTKIHFHWFQLKTSLQVAICNTFEISCSARTWRK